MVRAGLLDFAGIVRGVDVLDRAGNKTEESLPFTGGQVKWAYRPAEVGGQSDGVTEVRRSATLELAGPVSVPLLARRLRLWTDLLMPAGPVRFYRGVFDVLNPGRADDGVLVTRTLILADKSKRWADLTLTAPRYVPAGTIVLDYVRADLVALGETTFAFPGSTATLGQDQTFETGTSLAAMWRSLLESVAHEEVTATESGAPRTRPLADLAAQGPEWTYGAGRGRVIAAGSVDGLLPTLPNVVVFSARQGPSLGNEEDNGLTIRRNENTGPASIVQRGEEVPLTVSVDADDQETLEAIADADAQRYFAGGGERWSGKVASNPLAGDRDVLALDLPRLGVSGAWLCTSWSEPHTPISGPQSVLMDLTAERRVA